MRLLLPYWLRRLSHGDHVMIEVCTALLLLSLVYYFHNGHNGSDVSHKFHNSLSNIVTVGINDGCETLSVKHVIAAGIDAVVVLGGGLTTQGTQPLFTDARCDAAVHLYKCLRGVGPRRSPRILALSAGSVHNRVPTDKSGYPVFESMLMADYIMKSSDANSSDILIDTASYDTISNAYFARVAHAQPLQWSRMIVVTSKFHMARARFIFAWVFGLPDRSGCTMWRPWLAFVESEDVGYTPEELLEREKREEASLAKLENLVGRVTSLRQLYEWLSTSHDLYSAQKVVSRIPLALQTQQRHKPTVTASTTP